MESIDLPAVYPNYIYTTDESNVEENTRKDLGEEAASTAKPTDPDIDKQWFHNNVHTFDAWNSAKGNSIKVATIDTGISQKHPEFSGKFTAVNKVTWKTTDEEDNDGHGSHVAGLIAAKANNGYGGCSWRN